MASHTIAEVQTALNAAGMGPIAVDGGAGPQTDAAVAKFQASKGIKATGTLDPLTLNALFPGAVTWAPKTIQATAFDYFLNFAKSKTVWAAGALVALIAGWVNTRFGFNVPPEVQNTVTQLLVYVAGLLIWALQTWFNSPHVASKQPAVVLKPAETK